ncbi:MAG: PsbP-related protein [Pseudonocardiaceae bacterium]
MWDAVRKRRMLVITVGAVVAVGLGTSAAVWGPELFASSLPGKTTNTANSANTPNATDKTDAPAKALPAGFSQFRSDQAGFELAYPSNWTKLNPKDPQVLLLLAQGTQDSMLVRESELPEPVGPQQLASARQVTDKLVTSNKTVQMITDPKQIELGGLPGFFYFYSFKDATSGQEGAHSHFFLFNGKTMISMVFQTLPRERFAATAPTFDKVAASFSALKK